jgi:hypothetical protein
MHELHGVFAHTIYGDKIRVTNYADWDKAQASWSAIDWAIGAGMFPLLKFAFVRAWDDPNCNTARFVSIETVAKESANA